MKMNAARIPYGTSLNNNITAVQSESKVAENPVGSQARSSSRASSALLAAIVLLTGKEVAAFIPALPSAFFSCSRQPYGNERVALGKQLTRFNTERDDNNSVEGGSPLIEEKSESFIFKGRDVPTFKDRFAELKVELDGTSWQSLVNNKFDLLTVLLGYRCGCSVSSGTIPFDATDTPLKPIMELNGRKYLGMHLYGQHFIYDEANVQQQFIENGLLLETSQSSLLTPWQQLPLLVPNYLLTYQRESQLGMCHGIDHLNSEVCGSFSDYVKTNNIILSQRMLEYSVKNEFITTDQFAMIQSKNMPPRLQFHYSMTNSGIRLPNQLSPAYTQSLCCSELDLYDDEYAEDIAAFSDDLLFDEADEQALAELTVVQRNLFNQLYRRWSNHFDQITLQKQSLPEAVSVGDNALGRRFFVEPDQSLEAQWRRLFTEFKSLPES